MQDEVKYLNIAELWFKILKKLWALGVLNHLLVLLIRETFRR